MAFAEQAGDHLPAHGPQPNKSEIRHYLFLQTTFGMENGTPGSNEPTILLYFAHPKPQCRICWKCLNFKFSYFRFRLASGHLGALGLIEPRKRSTTMRV